MTSASGARATGTILDRIVEDRRRRVEVELRGLTESAARERASALPGATVDFASRLRAGCPGALPARLRLIAEVKRASPSKGVLDAGLDAAAQARVYRDAGAAAVSVLTEPDHFRGTAADLEAARGAFGGDESRPALLRKDFIFDVRQVWEAHAIGADALLLIVAMLEPSALRDLLTATRAQGLEALVEVHDADEVDVALAAGATVVGVNNRDLRTFREDLGTFERLAARIPSGVTLVAESAIRVAADARRMAEAGAHAILVGEALVTSGDVGSKARELMMAGEPSP
jgi:indole-3-glycerol phosphate synthase